MKKILFGKLNTDQKAQGMVEFALVLPILLLLVLGIIEAGRLLFYYGVVTNASREAARFGSAVEKTNNIEQYLHFSF